MTSIANNVCLQMNYILCLDAAFGEQQNSALVTTQVHKYISRL